VRVRVRVRREGEGEGESSHVTQTPAWCIWAVGCTAKKRPLSGDRSFNPCLTAYAHTRVKRICPTQACTTPITLTPCLEYKL
jgi:hypothetical protein